MYIIIIIMENVGFIGVHVGAGKYNEKSVSLYKKLCRVACERAIEVLNAGKSSLEAVTVATTALENSGLTNAGYGSNLTEDGYVECDASVMEGENMGFGAVGAVTRVKNPVQLAEKICQNQNKETVLGRIPPCILVGNGADNAAQKYPDISTVVPESLIAPNALKMYWKSKNLLSRAESGENDLNSDRLDTVGAVAIDRNGIVAASCSSGGILLKPPGRIGQAAVYGCGCWAENREREKDVSIAVSTSGCGEYLIKTMLAREISDRMKTETGLACTNLNNIIKQVFLDSRILRNIEEKLCGVLVLCCDNRNCEFLWAHSTPSLCIGYMSTSDKKATSRMSKLDLTSQAGKSLVVEGIPVFSTADDFQEMTESTS